MAALATSAFGLVAFAPSALAAPQTYTVNSAARPRRWHMRPDHLHAARGDHARRTRHAGDHDVINFSIGTGLYDRADDDLPVITDQVTIDGSTQGGYAGTPLVFIDGSLDTGMAQQKVGIWLLSGGNVIENIGINGFQSRQILDQSGSNTIIQNYLGVVASGNATCACGGNFDTVGLQNANDTSVDNNVIGGGQVGVTVSNSNAVSISGNNIGVGADFSSDIGSAQAGIRVTGTSRGTSIRFNNIANNGGLGIDLGGDGVSGNDAQRRRHRGEQHPELPCHHRHPADRNHDNPGVAQQPRERDIPPRLLREPVVRSERERRGRALPRQHRRDSRSATTARSTSTCPTRRPATTTSPRQRRQTCPVSATRPRSSRRVTPSTAQ